MRTHRFTLSASSAHRPTTTDAQTSEPVIRTRLGCRVLPSVIAALAIAAAAAVVPTLSQAAATQPAAASSSPGGRITRAEVLRRAQFWFAQPLQYTKSGGTAADPTGRPYRRDCSGMVSMALHLNSGIGLDTRGLAVSPLFTHINRQQLLPGDVLDYPAHHAILFDAWRDSRHITFSYYSFGHTPMTYYDGQVHVRKHGPLGSFNRGTKVSGWPESAYIALRYRNIVDTPVTPPPGRPAPVVAMTGDVAGAGDFTGDGRPDLFSIQHSSNGGRLWLYPGRAGSYSTPILAGSGGWNGMRNLVPVRMGDGTHAVYASDTAGRLFLYRANAQGVLTTRTEIGTSGWNAYRFLGSAGDTMGHDGFPDLTAVDTTGHMWLYQGLAKGYLGGRRLVGSSWNSMSVITFAGDLDGDSRPDLLSVGATNGDLYLYPGRDNGLFGTPRIIGQWWNGYRAVTAAGDLDGDGHPDLLAIHQNAGQLFLYSGRAGAQLAPRSQIGQLLP